MKQWTLASHRHSISILSQIQADHCPPLVDIPATLKCPADILTLVRAIETCQVCVGNLDDKFKQLRDHCQGHSHDQSGTNEGLLYLNNETPLN